jgi:acyl-CoA thioesterase
MNLAMYAEVEITKLDMPMAPRIVSDAKPILEPMGNPLQKYRIEIWNERGEQATFFRVSLLDYLKETSLLKLVDCGTTKLVVKDAESLATLLTISMLTDSY